MKKSIVVKGTIKVDKKGMSKVHAGESCASAGSGIVCKSYVASPQQEVTRTVIVVDKLIP